MDTYELFVKNGQGQFCPIPAIKGEDGVQIDDSTTSTEKTWSSSKINQNLSDLNIPSKTSELTNDSGFIPKSNLLKDVNVYSDFDTTNMVVSGFYINSYKNYTSNNLGLNYAKIPVTQGEKFKIIGQVYSAHTLYGFADINGDLISVYPTSQSEIIPRSGGIPKTLTEEVTIPNNVAFLVVNLGGAWLVSTTKIQKMITVDGIKENIEIPRYSQTLASCDYAVSCNFGNVLWGKKIATVGTSITYGAGAEMDDDNIRKTYGYYVAKRNNMSYVNYGVSGSTLQNIDGKNPFSLPNRYQNMDSDIDYLTIEFGWNDEAYGTLGAITDSDNSTFYGAWNVVLPWLIENYPNTKIGLIVPYLHESFLEWRDAVRIISKKYGLPYMDMMGDANVPCLYGRESSFNIDLDIKTLYRSRYLADGVHPNDVGYKAWATAYENFLRSM